MPGPLDRIHRILSDGLPPAGPPASLPRRTLQPVPAGLRARLEDLEATPRTQPPARLLHPAHPPGTRDGPDAPDFGPPAGDTDAPGLFAPEASLEERVGGKVRTTPLGEFLQIERRLPLSARHGRLVLGRAIEVEVPLREQESEGGALTTLHAADAVFLDTETTGLAGGTGTVAFLVGAGFVDGTDFVVRQYFLRDFPEESALLTALRADLGDRPIVSFNGRSFDWPLLTTRWRLHRRAHERAGQSGGEPQPRAHLDLLLTARRLWASTLHSHALSALERHVIGLSRGEDLSGWQIPLAWFDYLRGADRVRVAEAFRHNRIDVVSMLALMGEVGRILSAPGAQLGTPGDRLGTARLLLELGDEAGARACLQAGIEEASGPEQRPLHLLLGWMERRAEHDLSAQAHFEAAAALSAPGEVNAHEHVAKLLEHRRRDLKGALRWTEAAMTLVTPDSPAGRALRHRAERLHRRLARHIASAPTHGPERQPPS